MKKNCKKSKEILNLIFFNMIIIIVYECNNNKITYNELFTKLIR